MNGLFWGFLCLLLCAPRLVRAPRPIVLAALLCAVGEFVLMVPIWWPALLFGLKYNWTGKLFSILVSLLVIYKFKWVSPLETGLVRPQPGSWRVVGAVVAGLATVQLVSALITQGYGPSQAWESFWYQLTMPGIAEELFFRGTLLGLLGRAFPRNLPFLGTRTSWGGVVSVLLFVLAHGVTFRTGPLQVVPQVQFWPGQVADLVLWGTLFLWVRERSGSCFAAMATHNLINSCLVVGRALVR
ncbi:CPBP family intramembrane glutamic endopeptidase [Hymenobacter nivis]|uniref:CPBP family intramembrane glutamic endopeptidase n=1 Tax=Hymenobacter nivis TaxID=1850093 RepID=UPI0013A5A535|nr:CPBP family intramembrane glutamic endopeptidase [Hymenobacter nivis]